MKMVHYQKACIKYSRLNIPQVQNYILKIHFPLCSIALLQFYPLPLNTDDL